MPRHTNALRAAIDGLEQYNRLLVALTDVAKDYKNGPRRVTARNLFMICLIGTAPGGAVQTYRANREHAINASHHIKVLVERGHVALEPRNRGSGYAVQLTLSGKELYRKALQALR